MLVGVLEGVLVGVLVTVALAVAVGVFEGVRLGVTVGVLVAVWVIVGVGVFVAVCEGVGVAVGVGVLVTVGVLVGVAVGAPGMVTQAENSEVLPEGSVAVAVTKTSPGGKANGGSGPKVALGVPLPAQTPVVTFVEPRKVFPSPLPEGSQFALEKNSSR